MFCPYYKNKQIFDGFNEMIESLGGRPMTEEEFRDSTLRNLRTGLDFLAMEAAYIMYDRNGGNFMDSTPQGKPSILFLTLLDYFGGDRSKAILAKSNAYSDEFFNWFGNWIGVTNDDVNSIEILNDDGTINFELLESLSDEFFNNADESLFKSGRLTLRTRKEKHAHEKTTLEHLQNVVKSAQLSDISDELKQHVVVAAALHDLAKPFHGGLRHGFQSEEILNKIFKGSVSGLAKFAIAHHMMTEVDGATFTQDDANRIVKDAIKRNLDVNKAILVLIALHIADITSGRSLEDIDSYYNTTLRNVIDTVVAEEKRLLETAASNIATNLPSESVDKNGEPLMLFVIKNPNKTGSNNVYKNLATVADLDLDGVSTFDVASISSFGQNLMQKLMSGESVSSQDVVANLRSSGYFYGDNLFLSEILLMHDIPVVFDSTIGAETIGAADFNESGDVIIRLNPNLIDKVTKEFVGETVLHEIIHAVTVREINKGYSRFAKANRRMWTTLKSAFPKNSAAFQNIELGLYALQNEKEFASVFMTNELARSAFYSIAEQLDRENSGKFIQILKDFINNLVRLFINRDVFKTNVQKFNEYQNNFLNYLSSQSPIKSKKVSLTELKKLYWSIDKSAMLNESLISSLSKLKTWSTVVERNENTLKTMTLSFLNKGDKTYSFEDIPQKLQVRVNAIRTSGLSKELKTKLINSTMSLIDMFSNPQINRYTAITSTLRQIVPQLLEDVREILNVNANEQISLLPEEQMYQLHSNVGTYKDIADILEGLLNLQSSRNKIMDEYNAGVADDLKITEQDLNDLHTSVQELQDITQLGVSALEILGDRTALDILRKKAKAEDAEQLMAKYIENITENPAFDDEIGWFSAHFGAMDSQSNEALRALSSIVNRALQKADDATLDRTLKLIEAENNLKPGESVVQLYETDERGFTTGWILRRLNYGKFFKDYDKELIRINNLVNKEFKSLNGFKAVDLSSRVAPDSDILLTDDIIARLNLKKEDSSGKIEWTVRSAWNQLKNDWLLDHCVRKYNRKYYEAWNKVPQIAREALDAINSEISSILQQDGIFDTKDNHYHYDRLSDESWNQLQKLWILKKLLRSDYDIFGNKKDPDSTPGKIAKALQQLQIDLYGTDRLGEIKKDKKAWQDSLDELIKKCGGVEEFNKWKAGKKNNFNVEKYKSWHLRNSRLEFKKEEGGDRYLIDIDIENAMQGFSLDFGDKYNALTEEALKILKPYRAKNGEVIALEVPESAKNKLLDIYSELKKIRTEIFASNPNIKELFNKRNEVYLQFVEYVDTEYYKMLKEKIAEDSTDPETGEFDNDRYEAMLSLYGRPLYDYYTGEDLGIMPYRWLTRRQALDVDKYMEYVPGDSWIETVDDERFINSEYFELKKQSGNESSYMIPKAFDANGKKLYDNSENFAILDKNSEKYSSTLKALYDEACKVIKESNEMQTNRLYTDDYLLPQITGSVFKRMKRHPWFNRHQILLNWLRKRRGGDLKEVIPDKISILFRVLKELIGFGMNSDDLNQSGVSEAANVTSLEGETIIANRTAIHGQYADGRAFHILPQYYTRRMEDPSQISSDLVRILSNYYKMSSYYKEKLAIRDDCEVLVDFLKKRGQKHKKYILFGNDTESRVYESALKFLEMNLYDIRRTNRKLKIGSVEWNYAKAASTWRNWTTARNLGMNPKVALTGFLTSMGAHIMNSIVGQQYGGVCTGKAFLESIRRLAQSCFGARYLLNPSQSRDDMIVMAEWFGVSNLAERKIEGTNRNPLLQAAVRHSVFGLLSMADFWSKTQIMTSILMNHKYIDGKFLSQDDLRSSRWKFSSKEEFKQKMKEWKKSKNLYSLLCSDEDGRLVIDKKKAGSSYKEYQDAWDLCKHIVKDRIQKTAEYADGMATPLQKAAITQSIIGTLILIHRQYLPLIIQRHFGKRVYDYDTHMYKNGVFRSIFSLVGEIMRNNLLAGIGCGAFTGFVFGGYFGAAVGGAIGMAMRAKGLSQKQNKSVKEIFQQRFSDFTDRESTMQSYANRYAAKEFVWTNIIMYAAVQPLVALACSVADDDDDRWWVQMLAYALRAFEWEFYTAYRTDDMLNNVKSPTSAQAIIDNLEQLAFTVTPQTNFLYNPSQTWDDIEEIFKPDEIKKGAYKGWYPFYRDIFKLTPYHNVWEQYKNSKAKRKYMENQIMRIKKKSE